MLANQRRGRARNRRNSRIAWDIKQFHQRDYHNISLLTTERLAVALGVSTRFFIPLSGVLESRYFSNPTPMAMHATQASFQPSEFKVSRSPNAGASRKKATDKRKQNPGIVASAAATNSGWPN